MGALNRRALFGAAPALATLAMPAVAAPADDWSALKAALAVLNPDLVAKASAAQAAGWEPGELYCILCNEGTEPALMFKRRVGDDLKLKNFQHLGAH